jgi:hypothetical protein
MTSGPPSITADLVAQVEVDGRRPDLVLDERVDAMPRAISRRINVARQDHEPAECSRRRAPCQDSGGAGPPRQGITGLMRYEHLLVSRGDDGIGDPSS